MPSAEQVTHRGYSCAKCGNTFKRAEHLKRHTRSIHTTLKPFECDICGKTCSRMDNLQQHQRSHTMTAPERPKIKIKISRRSARARIQDSNVEPAVSVHTDNKNGREREGKRIETSSRVATESLLTSFSGDDTRRSTGFSIHATELELENSDTDNEDWTTGHPARTQTKIESPALSQPNGRIQSHVGNRRQSQAASREKGGVKRRRVAKDSAESDTKEYAHNIPSRPHPEQRELFPHSTTEPRTSAIGRMLNPHSQHAFTHERSHLETYIDRKLAEHRASEAARFAAALAEEKQKWKAEWEAEHGQVKDITIGFGLRDLISQIVRDQTDSRVKELVSKDGKSCGQ